MSPTFFFLVLVVRPPPTEDPGAGKRGAVLRAGNPRGFKVTVEVTWRPDFRGQEHEPLSKISQPASLCPPAPEDSGKMDGRGLWASRVRGSSCWSPEPGPQPGAAYVPPSRAADSSWVIRARQGSCPLSLMVQQVTEKHSKSKSPMRSVPSARRASQSAVLQGRSCPGRAEEEVAGGPVSRLRGGAADRLQAACRAAARVWSCRSDLSERGAWCTGGWKPVGIAAPWLADPWSRTMPSDPFTRGL